MFLYRWVWVNIYEIYIQWPSKVLYICSMSVSDGKMFGYGFVQMSKVEEAKEAVEKMCNKEILGRARLFVCLMFYHVSNSCSVYSL